MVTIRDVARLARTSPSAVSFVVNGKAAGLVSEPVQRRILKAIRDTGYRRDHAAAGLRLNRAFTVTLCVPARSRRAPLLGNLSHHHLVNRLAHHLHEAGYSVELLEVGPMNQAMHDRLERQRFSDGVLIVQCTRATVGRLAEALGDGKPVLAVDAPMEGPFDQPWQFGVDRERSFERGTRWLIDRGRRRIAMLDINLWPSPLTQSKRRGYEAAMRDAGLAPLPTYEPDGPTVRELRRTVTRLIAARPAIDGIVATDNYLTPMVQQIAGDALPELIGFGDEEAARLCDPPLAYLRLPIDELADVAVRALLARLEGEQAPADRAALLCELVEPR